MFYFSFAPSQLSIVFEFRMNILNSVPNIFLPPPPHCRDYEGHKKCNSQVIKMPDFIHAVQIRQQGAITLLENVSKDANAKLYWLNFRPFPSIWLNFTSHRVLQ